MKVYMGHLCRLVDSNGLDPALDTSLSLDHSNGGSCSEGRFLRRNIGQEIQIVKELFHINLT